MLLLMILIVLVRIDSFVLTQELRTSRKPLEHSHKHFNDSHELLFRGGTIRSAAMSLRATSTSRHAAHSSAEPRAISKNLDRSASENFPFPSAMFSGRLVEARSS